MFHWVQAPADVEDAGSSATHRHASASARVPEAIQEWRQAENVIRVVVRKINAVDHFRVHSPPQRRDHRVGHNLLKA